MSSGLDTILFITEDAQPVTLREAHEALRHGVPYTLFAPTTALLDCVEPTLDDEAGIQLVELLAHYGHYVPPLDAETRDELLIRALLLSTGGRIPLEVELALVALGIEAIVGLLARIPLRPLHETHIVALERFVSFLLDHPLSRPVTTEAVARWPDTPVTRSIKQMTAAA